MWNEGLTWLYQENQPPVKEKRQQDDSTDHAMLTFLVLFYYL